MKPRGRTIQLLPPPVTLLDTLVLLLARRIRGNAASAKWRHAHPEAHRAAVRRYFAKHPEVAAQWAWRRKQKQMFTERSSRNTELHLQERIAKFGLDEYVNGILHSVRSYSDSWARFRNDDFWVGWPNTAKVTIGQYHDVRYATPFKGQPSSHRKRDGCGDADCFCMNPEKGAAFWRSLPMKWVKR